MADLDVRLVRGAALAADLWYLTNADRAMTEVERTRGLVRAAIDHLVDNGLLLVPADVAERLDRQQKVEDLTWLCHSCGDERPDALISVVSKEYTLRCATGRVSLRFCNDRPSCHLRASRLCDEMIAELRGD